MPPSDCSLSPLGAAARGMVAAAVGTAAMTGYQRLVGSLRHEESEGEPKRWADAPAPALAGKPILSGLFNERVTLAEVPKLTQVMHWADGAGWGLIYGLVEGTLKASAV